MIRRLVIASFLALFVTVSGCKGTEHVMGTPSGGGDGRTLDSMLPYITKSLTAPAAELRFGKPDAASGAGLILFIYNVENGQKVNLAFPSPTDPISYASLQDKNGGVTTITLKD
jgi:hypothetical protein